VLSQKSAEVAPDSVQRTEARGLRYGVAEAAAIGVAAGVGVALSIGTGVGVAVAIGVSAGAGVVSAAAGVAAGEASGVSVSAGLEHEQREATQIAARIAFIVIGSAGN